jgi:hypothetical protein
MVHTQVGIFVQETREYISKLGRKKLAIAWYYSVLIVSDPGKYLECAFVLFLFCRKIWAVLKVSKHTILHGRLITSFAWLGVPTFSFLGPLECHGHHISKMPEFSLFVLLVFSEDVGSSEGKHACKPSR